MGRMSDLLIEMQEQGLLLEQQGSDYPECLTATILAETIVNQMCDVGYITPEHKLQALHDVETIIEYKLGIHMTAFTQS